MIKKDNKSEIDSWLLNNEVKRLKPGKARHAKEPGLACSKFSNFLTLEELNKKRGAGEAWRAKKKAWKKANKSKIKEWKARKSLAQS